MLKLIYSEHTAQFRAGAAPLALKTGCYQSFSVQERLCIHRKSVNRENVEGKKHVILPL